MHSILFIDSQTPYCKESFDKTALVVMVHRKGKLYSIIKNRFGVYSATRKITKKTLDKHIEVLMSKV